MSELSIVDVRSALNLNDEEKVMIVDLAQEVNPDYSAMTLDEIMGEDSCPMTKCSSMEEVRADRARKDAMDDLLDLQDRMSKGMKMISDMQRLGFEYGKAKDKFNKAKEVMFADETKKPQAWWNRFNQLKRERDAAWTVFSNAGGGDRMKKLWSHWMNLKDQGCGLAETYNLWSDFFKLVNEDITTYFTHGGDVQDQSVDSRHMDTIDALCLAYLEEQDDLRFVEDKPFTIPVKTHGYVPLCRDVTHEYKCENGMDDEEWDALLASMPF